MPRMRYVADEDDFEDDLVGVVFEDDDVLMQTMIMMLRGVFFQIRPVIGG